MSNRIFERTVGRVKRYFLEIPQPDAVFQFTARSLSAIRLNPKDRTIVGHGSLPLRPGSVLPSFDRANLEDPHYLEDRLEEAKGLLQLQEGSVALLLPELCFRVAVFASEAPSLSQTEREKMVWWRIRKLMPLLPEDARLSFDIVAGENSEKILAAVARSSVVQEYESLLVRRRLRTEAVGPPSLNLLKLLIRSRRDAEDAIIVNVEEESVALLAIIGQDISLYRVKAFLHEGRSATPAKEKIENIVKEIENTIHFVEDREKKKIGLLLVRRGMMEEGADFDSEIKARFPFPVESTESLVPLDLSAGEKEALSPLVGHIL